MTAATRPLFLDHAGVLGGAELALMEIAKLYRDRATVLLLADGPFRERLAAEGVKVSVIEGGSAFQAVRRQSRWPGLLAVWRLVRLAWQVARLARRHDSLHANSQKAFIVGCLASILARRPLIWELHDVLSTDHFSPLNIRVDVFLANHIADRVIANSRASAHSLIAHGGRPDRVTVVYNGIDAGPFDSVTPEQVESLRKELGLGPAPVIGVFGRLAEWKGQHVAIAALAELPGVHLLLVGAALFGERDYVERLRDQAITSGLADRVHFLGFRSDVPRLMHLTDLILHTSTAPEPFGRVIVEGMLAGRPVIATRGGGVEEIIEQNITGLLLPPGDPAVLAAAIRELLTDPARARWLAAAGRAKAATRFTVGAMVREKTRQIEDIARR